MYDYVDGKVDWMAYGLPVEGEDGPFLGDLVVEAPACDVGGDAAKARKVLEAAAGAAEVLVLSGGLVVGAVDDEALEGASDGTPLLDVMRPVPSTVRPSVTVASVAEAGGGSPVVTSSDGHLLGRAVVEPVDHDHHDHHDHHDEDDHEDVDAERYEQELGEVMQALQERFGDREVTEEEVHEFLRDRLVAEGKSVEEAERFLQGLDGGGG